VEIAPVPRRVDLAAATRESTLDGEPWTYAILARELASEGKLRGGRPATPPAPNEQTVDDLRQYVYAEARLELHGSAVAARLLLNDGAGASSHHGDMRLAIERDGWIRTAIPLGAHRGQDVIQIAWDCLSLASNAASGGRPRCRIQASRAFLLAEDYRPGPNLITPRELELGGGESGALPIEHGQTACQ